MRRVLTALFLAVLGLTFVACGARVGPPPGPPPGGQPALEVTAARLAQDFADDQKAANSRYMAKTFLISGTVARLTRPSRYDLDPGPDDDVDMILFFVPVTNKKTGEQVRYEVRCQFQPSLPAGQRKSLGLEKGKQVVLNAQCQSLSLDQPVVGFGNCKVVRVSEP
jgi:hypothetical protein